MSWNNCTVCGAPSNRKKWCNVCTPFQVKSSYTRKVFKSETEIKRRILVTWGDNIEWKWIKRYNQFKSITLKVYLKSYGLQEEPIRIIMKQHDKYLKQYSNRKSCQGCGHIAIWYNEQWYCFNCRSKNDFILPSSNVSSDDEDQ